MSTDASLTRTVVVRNAEGLHARPADLLVRMASKYQAEIRIGKNSEWVDCKSILSLLTLGAAQGTELSVTADGIDAADAIDSITALFEAGFDDTSEK
ncbi:HPr family phosphocarrier protein [Rubripirellula reticaptiva]|uniref:Phosphocarrier protein HPr n=1 Tax=Rubripirellula reticaptiva TaxID=2528013 RepID=A0A5C6F8T8_9BACT|nr:HPr family phosphocarrier protein [Rubripirellula reticaptiva]TWU57745.1 Phosphocarrier protein HPr [Rubripirellula reticaptiva]